MYEYSYYSNCFIFQKPQIFAISYFSSCGTRPHREVILSLSRLKQSSEKKYEIAKICLYLYSYMINFVLDKFEGPLALLLQLIEKEEMDITQVSLAKVADQYVTYIRQAQNIRPDEMADFLVVAARLLLIKSKALLPYLYPEEEEEISELEDQLRMYREFLEATKKIEKMLDKKTFMFPREFNRKAIMSQANSFSPPKNLQAEEMRSVFAEILMRLKPAEKLEEKTLEHLVNIEDKILSIQNMLLNRIKVSFNKVMADAKNKTEIVVSFLAILEMMRQREVTLVQDELFAEILIERIA